ncbi:MAG: serine/threonine protein kinase [Planctomycetaceae bacterium]|nr:serine/threonine protein kinase [Planctomycetaceae bacterium]
MSNNHLERTESYLSYSEQIDGVCDDFEAAWRRGSRIRIENCLRLVPEEVRADLLRELLEIEIPLRKQWGESLLSEQYTVRFPDHVDLVKQVFQKNSNARRLGDYELLEQLGRGGMGVVYKARQVYLNQIVAIKILPEQYMSDSHALSRFRREMQLIGGLKHPNIVQAYNAGEAGGVHYLVMEYVAGITLQRLIAERATGHPQKNPTQNSRQDSNVLRQLPDESAIPPAPYVSLLPETTRDHIALSEIDHADVAGKSDQQRTSAALSAALPIGAACEMIRQAALGLQHAHQRGLVHRDIKPGNLMLDRYGTVKILDLGLGKFQADIRKSDQSIGPLTQAGTTMGTVDYMAPEQWDDPTTVDIRADIYSLGNTLYFLLCGSPPFDGKNYDTNRAKLLAHIVAEPPSLRSANSNVSPELDRVYLKMVAKEREDRFATPLELATALEPFANFTELLDNIPKELGNISDAEQPTSSEYDNPRDTLPSWPTPSWPMTPSRRRRIAELTPPPKPWYRHQEFYAVVGLLNVVILVIGIWLLSRFWSEAPAVLSLDAGIKSPVGQNDENLNLRFDTTRRKQIAADLLELPGLSGTTWFQEVPWFLPFVREKIAANLLQSTELEKLLGPKLDGYLDTDTVGVQNWLWEATQKIAPQLTPPQRQLLGDIKLMTDHDHDTSEYTTLLEAACQKYQEGKRNQPSRAVDLHSEAVLLQMIAGLKNDPELLKQAEAKYREAIEGYRQNDDVSKRLQLFCQIDLGQLLARAFENYEASHALYREVLASPLVTDLLKVEIYTSLGMEQASSGNYDDQNFRIAQNWLERTSIGRKNHPLAAHIAERFAWSLIDQWKVTDSRKQFEIALNIRTANSREGRNPFAGIYELHNRHGLAMVNRYRGDLELAKVNYSEVVRDIQATLAREEASAKTNQSDIPGQLRYFRELRERLANSRERWADCELFGGAASGSADAKLVQAETLYDQARQMTGDQVARIIMTCKMCMVQALLGKTSEAKANLSESDSDVDAVINPASRYKARNIVADVKSMIAIKETEIAAGTAANTTSAQTPDEAIAKFKTSIERFRTHLQNIAAQSGNDPIGGDSDRNRRDSMEFRLLDAEFLLYAEAKLREFEKSAEPPSKEDIAYLNSQLAFFLNRQEMKPFVRRYYDWMLHLADKSDPKQLAAFLREKLGTPAGFVNGNDKGPAHQLLFQLSKYDHFVLYQPDNVSETQLYPVPVTREQIKEAANFGKEIDLPQELAGLFASINELRNQGRIVNIYWNDASCWANEKDALTDAEWPFKTRLSLK